MAFKESKWCVLGSSCIGAPCMQCDSMKCSHSRSLHPHLHKHFPALPPPAQTTCVKCCSSPKAAQLHPKIHASIVLFNCPNAASFLQKVWQRRMRDAAQPSAHPSSNNTMIQCNAVLLCSVSAVLWLLCDPGDNARMCLQGRSLCCGWSPSMLMTPTGPQPLTWT